jgi:hypothetical protein
LSDTRLESLWPARHADAPIDWWRPGGDTAQPVQSQEAEAEPPRSALPFRALLAFLFVLFIAPQHLFPALAPLRIAFLAAAVAIFSHTADCFTRSRPLGLGTRELRIAGALVAWAVLTLPLSRWPGGSAAFLWDVYLKSVAVLWLLGSVVNTPLRLRRTIWLMALMSVPLAATAVSNFLEGVFVASAHSVRRIVGYHSGLTGNPNDLALMLNIMLPLMVGLLMTTRRPALRALLLAMSGLQVVGIVVTFSRAGFLTLAITAAHYFFRFLATGRLAWATLILMGALSSAAALPGDYRARLATILDVEADVTGSAQARRTDTIAALRLVAANPIVGGGVGVNVLSLNEERGETWKEVHNAYLVYAVDLGLPGLFLFLLLIAACFKSVRSSRRDCARAAPGSSLGDAAEALEAALVAFCIGALFAPVAYQFYFYLIAGLVVALRSACDAELRLARAGAAPSRPPGPRPWTGVGCEVA